MSEKFFLPIIYKVVWSVLSYVLFLHIMKKSNPNALSSKKYQQGECLQIQREKKNKKMMVEVQQSLWNYI